MKNYQNNPVVRLSFEFSLRIIEFTEQLQSIRKFRLADQLFRSGTSIGANIREAQGAESKADFIHKLKIAFKEAEEAEYWLELCENAKSYLKPGKLLNDVESLKKILSKIISTSKR